MALNNCPACGKQISSRAAYCPHCGEPFQTQEPKIDNMQQESIQQHNESRKNSRHKILVLLLIAVGVLLVVLVGVIAYNIGTKNMKVISTESLSESDTSTSGSSKVSVSPDRHQETFTVKGISFTMINVEGGTFTMGATDEQGSDYNNDELPTHQVTLSSFSIGQTEVTQDLWQAVMGNNPSSNNLGGSYPVENVSWNDCQKFIAKLNQMTGENFRLPTEAEWEFAARGGNNSHGYKYPGSNNINDVAWYSCGSIHVVATKIANELGLYDMAGNVEEYCHDWYGPYSAEAQINPQGLSSGSIHVDRGSSYLSGAIDCRVSRRDNGNSPSGHISASDPDLGLRLAL